jgi:hypothetical protein
LENLYKKEVIGKQKGLIEHLCNIQMDELLKNLAFKL